MTEKWKMVVAWIAIVSPFVCFILGLILSIHARKYGLATYSGFMLVAAYCFVRIRIFGRFL